MSGTFPGEISSSSISVSATRLFRLQNVADFVTQGLFSSLLVYVKEPVLENAKHAFLIFFNVLLTVHLSISLDNDQLDAEQFSLNQCTGRPLTEGTIPDTALMQLTSC